jgi:hypothetical protein
MTNKEIFFKFTDEKCHFNWEAAREFYDNDEEKVNEALHRFYDGFAERLDESLDEIFDPIPEDTDIHPYTTEYNREIDYAAAMGYSRF